MNHSTEQSTRDSRICTVSVSRDRSYEDFCVFPLMCPVRHTRDFHRNGGWLTRGKPRIIQWLSRGKHWTSGVKWGYRTRLTHCLHRIMELKQDNNLTTRVLWAHRIRLTHCLHRTMKFKQDNWDDLHMAYIGPQEHCCDTHDTYTRLGDWHQTNTGFTCDFYQTKTRPLGFYEPTGPDLHTAYTGPWKWNETITGQPVFYGLTESDLHSAYTRPWNSNRTTGRIYTWLT